MAETRMVQGVPYTRQADGTWRKAAGATPPADPSFQYEGQQAAANVQNTVARTEAIQRGNDINERRVGLDTEAAARARKQYPIPKEDMARINEMRAQSGGMQELLGRLKTATGAIDRFNPGPGRGTTYQNFYAEPDDGLVTGAVKGIGRAFLPDQSERDYEVLRAMQEGVVLKTQEAQKGPQTEADAARMKASTISPTKGKSTNALLAAESIFNARMAEERPGFYTKWANRHGSLTSLDPNGRSVDQAWSSVYRDRFDRLRKDPRYNRLIGGGGSAKPRTTRPSDNIIDLDDY